MELASNVQEASPPNAREKIKHIQLPVFLDTLRSMEPAKPVEPTASPAKAVEQATAIMAAALQASSTQINIQPATNALEDASIADLTQDNARNVVTISI